MTLVVLATHPVQYHAPIYQALQKSGIPVTAVYGSDFSVRGGVDVEFGASVKWDTDLVSGYTTCFLGHADGPPDRVSMRELAQHVDSAKPSAILISGYSGGFHTRAIATVALRPTPLIFRAETTDHAVARSPGRALVRDGILRALYARCRVVCPIGTRSRQHYERLGVSQEKLIGVPYCVNTSPFQLDRIVGASDRVRVRADLNIPRNAPVFLYSGKLSVRKGVDDLLKSVRGLSEVHVIFMGSGERMADLQAEARGELASRLHFIGFKNQRQMSPFFHASDALVLPSRFSETWGLVVNEALHHGIPVVASDCVGCVPDLIVPGQTGEVFVAGNPSSLAAALERLLVWFADEGVAQRCHEQVRGYSLEAAVSGLREAYERSLR